LSLSAQSGHCSTLARNASVANDPKRHLSQFNAAGKAFRGKR
jgi:hypothetical protein